MTGDQLVSRLLLRKPSILDASLRILEHVRSPRLSGFIKAKSDYDHARDAAARRRAAGRLAAYLHTVIELVGANRQGGGDPCRLGATLRGEADRRSQRDFVTEFTRTSPASNHLKIKFGQTVGLSLTCKTAAQNGKLRRKTGDLAAKNL